MQRADTQRPNIEVREGPKAIPRTTTQLVVARTATRPRLVRGTIERFGTSARPPLLLSKLRCGRQTIALSPPLTMRIITGKLPFCQCIFARPLHDAAAIVSILF